MGRGWRRITEAVRQKIPIGEEFEATSNLRNEAMFKEASDFSLLLKVMEKDMLALEKQVEVQFNNLRNIMVATLPRVYDMEGRPIESHPNTNCHIGQNVNVDKLTESLAQMRDKIGTEVFGPMSEWNRDYKKVQNEMKKLEAMRLEVDSRRRTVVDLDRQLAMQKMKTMKRAESMREANGGTYVEDIKMADMIKNTDRKKAHKEDKMQDIRTSFINHEEVVFNSLYTLIDDARSLRDYAATALSHVQECFSVALSAFDGPGEMQQSGGLDQVFGGAQASNPPEKKKSMLRAFSKFVTGNGGNDATMSQRDNNSGGRGNDQRGGTGGGFDAVPVSTAPHGKIAPPAYSNAQQQQKYSDYDLVGPAQQAGSAYIQQQYVQQQQYAPQRTGGGGGGGAQYQQAANTASRYVAAQPQYQPAVAWGASNGGGGRPAQEMYVAH